MIHGHDIETLADEIRAALPTLSVEFVLALLETDRKRALCWLGIVGPSTPDPTIAEILEIALASDDPEERNAAAFAKEALSWP